MENVYIKHTDIEQYDNVMLLTITWSYESSFNIENTTLYKSFKHFNPTTQFKHIHFDRRLFEKEETEFNQRFGTESEYILYKIVLLKKTLREINTDYVIFCDANDVVCLSNIKHLFHVFNLEHDIIVGAEKNQWPIPERKLGWSGFVDYTGVDAKNHFYVNSGMILAKTINFIKMLESMETNILTTNIKNFINDQAIYTWHYTAKHLPLIKLDYDSIFVVNTFKRSTEEYYLDNKQNLVSKLTGKSPCFVHDNGWNYGSPRFITYFELRHLYSKTYSHLKNLSKENHSTFIAHEEYLTNLRDNYNFTPNVVWDVGACVLHWTTMAKRVWPNSEYILFEAMEESEELFAETNHKYCIGVFSDIDDKEVVFYKNIGIPGGNSYYMENPKHSSMANSLFASPSNQRVRKTITLDTAQIENNLHMPDLLKLDVQGCELDILKGATNVIKNVKHLIVELQHIEYNIGAQLCINSIPFIESLGFKLVTPKFAASSHADADYHFIKA